MSPGDIDARVMRLTRESRVWRTSAAVLDRLIAAWQDAATGRLWAAVVEAEAAVPLRRVRALAEVTLVAGLTAAAGSVAAPRRDGATWLVPVVAAVAAAVVIAIIRAGQKRHAS